MALRNQPYIPLYVQDFMTDEKLMECSASATGVYVRVMCVMHKSKDYGTILLKQNDKQTESTVNNFALKLAKFLPYPTNIILSGLEELINEEVLSIDGDILSQKRMLKDSIISDKRSLAGSKGGQKTTVKNQTFALAKSEANSENESESEYENENEIKDVVEVIPEKVPEKFDFKKSLIIYGFKKELVEEWLKVRKTKKATNTQTTFNKFIREIEKSDKDKDEILELCVSKDWKSFEIEWLSNITQTINNGKSINNTGSGSNSGYQLAKVNPERTLQRYSNDIANGNIPGVYHENISGD